MSNLKKIISYSLFSSDKRYLINAFVNIELCLELYSDWICRIYYDESVPFKIIDKLSQQKIELIKETGSNHDRRMWRFYAYDDSDIFISRDIDSHINLREKLAVETWINSDKNLHIMRDHNRHKNKILAGMFGLKKNNKLENLKQKILSYVKQNKNTHKMDENFLADFVYPLYKNDMMVFDNYNFYKNEIKTKWPISIIDNNFIGKRQHPPTENIELYKKYESDCIL